MKDKKKGKYAAELEKLRELNAINEVLKKSEIENAALTNASKDSEVVSDSAIDNMLDQLNLDKNASKDLEIIESLTASTKNGGSIVSKKHTKITKTKKGIQVKKQVHMKKIKKASPKKKR